jgi:hypothetical protein
VVQAGTLFGYLAAFVTIVLALALSDLAMSLHRLIRARRIVRWHPLPLVAAFWVLLVLLTSFFGLWSLTELSRVSYLHLFWIVLPQVCYFLAAAAVLPDEAQRGMHLLKFYLAERRYLFAVLALGFSFELIDDVVREYATLTALPPLAAARYFASNGMVLAAFAAMWASRRRWVHWAGFVVLFLTALLAFVGWDVHGAPAVEPVAGAAPAAASRES